MILTLGITALASNGNSTNGKVSNVFLTGRVDYKDYNNANFHCNAINGNGRVWTTLGKDYTQQMNDLLTFERTDLRAPQSVASKDTTWLLINRATQEPIMSANGKKIEGWKPAVNAEMFICEQCGSQLWVSFSNNSGEPDGKNIQITHPGKNIEIVKVWLDAEGNVIKNSSLSAKFTITWTGKDGVERSMKNIGPGKYFFPEDLIDSIVVTESGVTKNYTLIEIGGRNVIGVISGQLEDDAVTFTNKEDPHAIIFKEWDIDGKITKGGKITIGEGEDAVTIEALFDIYAYDEDANGKPVRGKVLFSGIKSGQKVYLDPDNYIVAEQPKANFVRQSDKVIEVGENKVGTCTFLNKPDVTEKSYGDLTFEKKIKTDNGEMNIVEWLNSKGLSLDICLGLEFILVASDGTRFYREVPDAAGVVTFLNLPAGAYTLKEEVKGLAVGVFKQMDDINVTIVANSTTPIVLGGTVKGNIEGADVKSTDLFTIVNGYGTGNTLNYPGLNNNGDLFYIGVTNTRTANEFASFCAYPGAHWFAGNGGGAGIGYMVARSIEDAKYQQAFNFIVDEYYSEGDFFLYNSEARRVAQTVVWALLGAIDVTSEAWDNVSLTDAEKDAVIATLAAVEDGYVGKGLVIDVVYMLGVDSDLNQLEEAQWINAQPQIVPIFGTFYVVNEEGDGPFYSKPAFNKTVYGKKAGSNEFAFDLFKKVNGDWVRVEASDFDIPLGEVFTGSRFSTNSNGIVTTDFDLKAGSYMFKEVPKFFWDEPFHGEDGDYNLLWAANYPGGKDALYFEMVLDGNQYVVAWADYKGAGVPTVDNVITCKHNAFWNNLDFYYGILPHEAIRYEGGWIIDFDDFCTGYLVPTYQPARCGVPGYIWYNCFECAICTSIIVEDALEHNMVPSGEFKYDDDNVAVGEWYTCDYCGTNELRYFEEA